MPFSASTVSSAWTASSSGQFGVEFEHLVQRRGGEIDRASFQDRGGRQSRVIGGDGLDGRTSGGGRWRRGRGPRSACRRLGPRRSRQLGERGQGGRAASGRRGGPSRARGLAGAVCGGRRDPLRRRGKGGQNAPCRVGFHCGAVGGSRSRGPFCDCGAGNRLLLGGCLGRRFGRSGVSGRSARRRRQSGQAACALEAKAPDRRRQEGRYGSFHGFSFFFEVEG